MALEKFRLDGRVAMITGAGRGVGKVTAQTMAEAGAKIAICGRTLEPLKETAREIEAAGGEALVVQADVSSEAELKVFVDQTMDRFGKIDCLVNNAGGNDVVKRYFDWTEQELIDQMRWNVSGAYMLSQLVGRHMIAAGKGAIVNISSEASRTTGRGLLPYGVAKAALNHLTVLVAQELAPKVRCNALSLGPILTPLLKSVFDRDPKIWENMLEKVPLRKIGDPMDIALAALFLCSDASSYISGIVVPVSGGITGDAAPFAMPDL